MKNTTAKAERMWGHATCKFSDKGQFDETDVLWEPAKSATAELKIKRSLFIGHSTLCKNGTDMRAFLEQVKTEHKNANHNCWAYRLSEPETEHCSDDGEPSGTAGKPILGLVRQSGMVNLMVVVTRYFGGIHLGVRGLIEAYGQTAKSVIAETKSVLRVRSKRLAISLPYNMIGDVTNLLEAHGINVPAWDYGTQVDVSAEIRLSALPQVTAALDELQARGLIFFWSV
jgi:uncharacterized YigZ family protein